MSAKNPHAVAPCCRRCAVKLPRDPCDIYALLGYCVKCLPWQFKRVAAQHYETRAVLAGAYVSAMTMLTHAVTVDADGRDASVLCKRVKLDSLADAYALTTEGRQAEPTCQVCATKWKKAIGR